MASEEYKGIIFDLDGTLLDSMGMWADIDVEYLGNLGIECPENLQRDLEGYSYEETALYFKKRFNIKDSTDTIKETWRRMCEYRYCKSIPLKPGAAEYLKYLRDRGCRCAIASSNSRELIEKTLEARNLRQYFDAIVTCDEAGANKPDPSVYLKAAEILGVGTDECMVFEDILHGLKGARNAGMYCVCMDDKYSDDIRNEKEALCDRYIYDFREMMDDAQGI